MASQSNVYPCSYSVSRLICHALTSLYFWLLILIFTSNVLTFILLWKHLFNANAPNQRELCTHSSFLLCPTNLTYLAFSQCIFVLSNCYVLIYVHLKCHGCVKQKQYFHPLIQTHFILGMLLAFHDASPLNHRGRLRDRPTCVVSQTECPADSTECSRMYKPSYAVLLL